MPYRRRTGYRKFTRTRRRVPVNKTKQMVDGRGQTMVQKIANRYAGPLGTIARTVSGIMNLVNSEPKFIDTNATLTAVGTAGLIVPLTLCAQGNGDQNRSGNTVLIKDVTVKIDSAIDPDAAACITRIMLFIDKETDGALPTAAQLLTLPTNPHSMLNRDYSKRFVVIFDRTYDLSLNGDRVMSDKFYKKIPIHTYYDGSLANISDAKENQIYLYLFSSDNTQQALFTYQTRVNFFDN